MKIQLPMSILLYIFTGGCSNGYIKSVDTSKQEKKTASFNVISTASELSLNITGLDGIDFGISIEDTFLLLKKMDVKYSEINGSYHAGIKLTNAKIYGIDIPVAILEYDASGKLDKYILNTANSTWKITTDALKLLNKNVTEIYGEPLIVNNPNEYFYEEKNTIEQKFVEWPIVNRRHIVSTVYKRGNGYYGDLSIFNPLSALRKPVATTPAWRPVLLPS